MNKNIRNAIFAAPLAGAITLTGFTGAFADDLAPVEVGAGASFGAAAVVDIPNGPVDGATLPVPEPVGSVIAAPGEAPVLIKDQAPDLVDTPNGPVDGATLPVPEPVGSVIAAPGEAPVLIEDQAPVEDDTVWVETPTGPVDGATFPIPEPVGDSKDAPVAETPEVPVQEPVDPPAPSVIEKSFNVSGPYGGTLTAPVLTAEKAAAGASYTNARFLIDGVFAVAQLNLAEGAASFVDGQVVFTPAEGFSGAVSPITVQYVQTNPDGSVSMARSVLNFTVEAAPEAPVEVPVNEEPVLVAPETPVVDEPSEPVVDNNEGDEKTPVVEAPVVEQDETVSAPVAFQDDAGAVAAPVVAEKVAVAPVVADEDQVAADDAVPSVFAANDSAPIAEAGYNDGTNIQTGVLADTGASGGMAAGGVLAAVLGFLGLAHRRNV